MRFEVLGPLRVTGAEGELPLGGPKQRLVMALLIDAGGRPVSTAALIDGVWGEQPPATARKALQGYVHHLRAQVGDVLVTESNGYSLGTHGNVDAIEFEKLRREAVELSDVDAAQASNLLRSALALWNGPAYADLADEPALTPEVARLEDLRIDALGDRIDADLALGRHRALVGELEGLVHEYPLQERFRAQLMTALYRAGRQVEALRSYEHLRRYLLDEMGLEPSPELQRLEQLVLNQDDALTGPEESADSGPTTVRGYELRERVAGGNGTETHRAYQRSLGRLVAVEVLDARVADDPQFIADFATDTKAIASLDHPHICLVVDSWREPGRAYRVSRWLDGGSLGEMLHDGPMAPAAAFRMIDEVGSALALAHREGVVHGQLTPERVRFDESGHAYLAAFAVGPKRRAGSPAQDRLDFAALAHLALSGTRPRVVDGRLGADLGDADLPAAIEPVFEIAFSHEGYERVEDLLRALRQAGGLDAVAPPASPPAPRFEARNPYKGLRAFQESDAADFFGRDDLIETVAEQLDRHRLVAVVGPSGSGKSSAVKAGVLPRLRGRDAGSPVLISEMYPGAYPFEELESALLRVGVNRTSVIQDLLGDERGLLRVLKQILPSDDAELVLVIDQFEELFSMVDDEPTRQLFLDSLVAATSDPRARLRVIVTMRADFFDRPLEYAGFGAILERGLVPVSVPGDEQLALAIAQPARAVGVEFEEGMIAQVVHDVAGQPGGLPLLQYVLTELFDERDSNTIGLAAYQRSGAVFASLGRRAESLYEQLTPDAQDAARNAFLRMVSVDEGTDDLRRRVRRGELSGTGIQDQALNEAIQHFGAHRLLTFDRDPVTRGPTVEVAHEALLREWPRLAGWIDEQRDDLMVRRRLDAGLVEWHQSREDPSYLPTGGRLAQFQEWSSATPLALSPGEHEFLGAALEREAHLRSRASRRRRMLTAVLGAAAALFAVVAAFAFVQKRSADQAASDARAAVADADLATLISRSAAQSAGNPELSVLLALEAHRRSPSAETEYAVLNALGSARSANRIASFPELDVGDCPVPPHLSANGLGAHAIIDGRLTSLDLTSGQVSDRGAARERCGFYVGDPIADWAAVGSSDAEISFVGPYDDPYAVELQYEDTMWLIDDMDLSAGIAVGVIQRANGDFPVVLFDTTTGAQIGDPIGQGALWRDAIDRSGSFYAVSHQAVDAVNQPGHLRIVDARTGDELFHIETPPPVSSLTFDPAGPELIAGMASGDIMTVDLVTGEVVSEVETTASSPVREVAVRPDGLIVALSEGQVETVDRRSGPTGDRTDLRDVALARLRDDGLVLIRRSDGSHDLIDLDGSALVERSWPVRAAAVAFEDGLATVLSQPVTVVDLATGEQTEIELHDRDGSDFVANRVYPDPDALLGVDGRGIMGRWEGGEMVERIDLSVNLYTWYRIGDTIASLGIDAAGNEVASLSSLARGSAGIRFTVPAPDGTAAHPALDGGMHVFDAFGTLRSYGADGELTNELDTGAGAVGLIAVDSTTGRLAAVSSDQPAVVIDPSTGEVAELAGSGNIVNLAFGRAGRLLVVTGFNGDVTVWDVDSRQLAGLAWDGTGANLSPQSWYDESTGSMWVFTSDRMLEIPLDPQQWVERACTFVGRDMDADEWSRYVPGDSTPQSACP